MVDIITPCQNHGTSVEVTMATIRSVRRGGMVAIVPGMLAGIGGIEKEDFVERH
jgi:hypothetical protein